MLVVVKKRDGSAKAEITLPKDATREDLAKAFMAEFPNSTPERTLFSHGKTKLNDDVQLTQFADKSGTVIVTVKDLGRQISWKHVFLIEYAGPIIIHPLIFCAYTGPKSDLQKVILALIVLHFIKRELETLFVHRFSNATMPFMNVFKNSFHYWLLSGFWIAYDVYAPKSQFASAKMSTRSWVLVVLWILAEASNLSAHWTLRTLRPPGTRIRKIPYGYGFSRPFNISFPNYFFEAISWFLICGLCYQSIGVWVFFAAATGQMYIWAVKKHELYLKEFSNYPKNRAPMWPSW